MVFEIIKVIISGAGCEVYIFWIQENEKKVQEIDFQLKKQS
jgi:hypothetical protein